LPPGITRLFYHVYGSQGGGSRPFDMFHPKALLWITTRPARNADTTAQLCRCPTKPQRRSGSCLCLPERGREALHDAGPADYPSPRKHLLTAMHGRATLTRYSL